MFAACGKGTVGLAYKFPVKEQFNYRWTIDAKTSIERSTHSLRFVIDAIQTFGEPTAEGGALLQLTLDTISRTEDGVTFRPGTPPVTLALQVRPDGSVKRAEAPPTVPIGVEVDRLLAEAFPRLPNRSVEIGESWNTPVIVKEDQTSIDLEGTGRLVGFELRDRRRLALVNIQRTGRITTVQTVGRAQLTLTGTSTITSNAEIDLDKGILFGVISRSVSDFDISAGGAPAGTRKLVIVTRVALG